MRGLCDSVATIAPGLRASFPSAVDGAGSTATPGKDLADWVQSHLPSGTILVAVDNLDECSEIPGISEFLLHLTNQAQSRVKWLLAYREQPTLPLASWLAYNISHLPIDADDLRFTLDDVRQLAAADSINASDDALREIHELTAGWPVAVCLAMKTAVTAHDLKPTGKTREMLFSYLIDKVWRSLDTESQQFLSIATFLPYIDAGVISLAGFSGGVKMLDQLHSRIGLVKNAEDTFEVHRLFRDFVRSLLKGPGEKQFLVACRSAADVLDRMGRHFEALDRYVESQSLTDVERLLTKLNFALIELGHSDLTRRALGVVGSESSPAILALRAALDESRGRVASAELFYSRALAIQDSSVQLRVAIACRYSLLLFQQGRTDAMALLQGLWSREDLTPPDRCHVGGALAMLFAFEGQHGRAKSYMDEATSTAQSCEDALRARTLGRASTVAFFAHDHDSVIRYAREAAVIAEELGLHELAGRAKTSISSLHTASGRIGLAANYARQVAEHARKAGDPYLRARGLRELLALEAEIGNDDALAAIESELQTISYDGPAGLIGLIVSRGMSQIWRSAFTEAIDTLTGEFHRDLTPHQNAVRTSLLAVAAAAQRNTYVLELAIGSYERACEDDLSRQSIFDRERALSCYYLALALSIDGRRRLSIEYQKRAAQLGHPDHPFGAALEATAARSKTALIVALDDLIARSQGGIAKVISASTKLLSVGPTSESLTQTERIVLQALSKGLSNKEIALANRRSVNTVRGQVSSILRKLCCDSRGEAVAVARSKGML